MIDTRSDSASSIRVLIAMGTRPEIIKLAPLIWAARKHSRIDLKVCHSGQHSDLAEPMLEYFQVQPDIQLNLMKSYSNLTALAGGCMLRMEGVFQEHQPQVIVTQGDTATCAAMSLAAFYSRIPVVHVEAGLRTGDLQSPWPEELNRRIATLAASLHCAPTEFARQVLIDEGVEGNKIIVSGNPVVDALQWTMQREDLHRASDNGGPKRLVVLTAHRRENFGKPLESICAAVLQLSERFSDHRFVFVTHPNPNAGPTVRKILEGKSRIELAPPMSYPEFVRLMSQAKLVISDSGGIQEEAPTLNIPLLVTRTCTERPEAVQCGAAELVGTNQELLIRRATELLSCDKAYSKMAAAANPFGTGQAGQIIVDEIVARFGTQS
jgi:UDP-N-acetylglucosamine 2-epimerase (non-hydrolysing)